MLVMKNSISRIHFYIVIAILITLFIDQSGLLTKSNFEIYKVKYSEQNVVTKIRLNPFKLDAVLDAKDKESLNLVVFPNGFGMSSVLTINYSGAAPIFKDMNTQSELKCPATNSDNSCRLTIKLSGTESNYYIFYAKNAKTFFHSIDIKTYRAKRETSINGSLIYVFYIFMAIIGVLLVKLSSVAINIFFVSVSSVILILLDSNIFLLIFIFLLTSFYLINIISTAKSKRRRNFIFFMFVILISLFSVKILFPYVSQYFLNPGGILLAVPLGFSYFIIKIVDMGIDSYKKNIEKLTLLTFFSHMLFPSTLAAGPIKTYKQFINAKINEYSIIDYSAGIARVLIGISKKLIADALLLPIVIKNIDLFANHPDSISSSLVFTMLLTNFFYIYLDFSAYCDMAIGSARSMGYRVPENFKWPILRTSVSQYWQHWHMTLSLWVRKNVFMNTMLSTRSLFMSTFSAMLVIGLWHKFSLGWLCWALHHTVIMRTEDFLKRSNIFNITGMIHNKYLSLFLIKIKHLLMMFYVWFLVSAGQSFILFSDFSLSLKAYMLMYMFIPEWLYSLMF